MTKVIHKPSKPAKPKVLVILGTTSAGKTGLAVRLAKELGGEIVSADSRQVYKGLDIGTGKDLPEYKAGGRKISYHLIDVASPKIKYDLARYQKDALGALEDILKRGKLPIIVGGSGLYLQALVDNYQLGGEKPDHAQRSLWEQKPAAELFKLLTKKKPEFAERLNNSDKNNPRRLARYLEILAQGGTAKSQTGEKLYDYLILGLDCPEKILRERVYERLVHRLEKEDLAGEVKRLHEAGLSWERLDSFGLEYRFVSRYLRGQLKYEEMLEKLNRAIYGFAKRQKTWFRRWAKQGAKIHWVEDKDEAVQIIKKWL